MYKKTLPGNVKKPCNQLWQDYQQCTNKNLIPTQTDKKNFSIPVMFCPSENLYQWPSNGVFNATRSM